MQSATHTGESLAPHRSGVALLYVEGLPADPWAAPESGVPQRQTRTFAPSGQNALLTSNNCACCISRVPQGHPLPSSSVNP